MQRFSDSACEPARVSMAVLGDSLAYGLGASKEDYSLARRLYHRMRTQCPGSTYANFAVPYATLGDVLRHQVPVLRGAQADVVFLVAGANDLRYTRDVFVVARRFRHLLAALHEAAPQAQIVAAGMPDVTRTIAVPRLLKPGICKLCARINATMRRIVLEAGDEFVDLFTFTNAPLKPVAEVAYLCADGFHPSDDGYAEIADRAFPAFEKLLSRA